MDTLRLSIILVGYGVFVLIYMMYLLYRTKKLSPKAWFLFGIVSLETSLATAPDFTLTINLGRHRKHLWTTPYSICSMIWAFDMMSLIISVTGFGKFFLNL